MKLIGLTTAVAALATVALADIAPPAKNVPNDVAPPAEDTHTDGDQERPLASDTKRWWPSKEAVCEKDCLGRKKGVFDCENYYKGDFDCKKFCKWICWFGDMETSG